MEELKKAFLKNVAVNIAINGALGRNHIYLQDSNTDRKEFRKSLKAELIKVVDKLLKNKDYTEIDHFKTIKSFANSITRKHSDILNDNCFSIGTSQKLINLYWKMLWVFDDALKKPIHCPFDSIIISKLNTNLHHIKWTKMNTLKEYKSLVKAATEQSGGVQNIATWELRVYNEEVHGGTIDLEV